MRDNEWDLYRTFELTLGISIALLIQSFDLRWSA